MVSFAAPLWLLGLALLPLIWWLHRLRAMGPEFAVSALFLWRLSTPADGSGGQRTKPERYWWLRALIMTGLVLALSGPQWLSRAHRVTVWFDDSLSMFTREGDTSRIDHGIAQLTAALHARHADQAWIHSLSRPGLSLALTREQADRWPEQLRAWLKSPRGEPRPPAAVEMAHDSEHWLVTDGASAGLSKWLQVAPVTRVLALGQTRANAAVTVLALRPALRTRDILEGLVAVANPGPELVHRELVLKTGEQEVLRKPLALAPAGRETLTFELPIASEGPLYAELLPTDALPLDDRLSVPLPGIVGISLHGDCGRHLRTALSAHPYLQVVGPGQAAQATIVCGAHYSRLGKPGLLFRTGEATRSVTGVPQWSEQAGELSGLSLVSGWLRAYPVDNAPGAGLPLLVAGDSVLIDYHVGKPAWAEVLLDMEGPSWVGRPEYLALIDGLLAKVLGRPLLDVVSRAGRAPEPSRIVPTPLGASPRPTVDSGQSTADLGGYFIVLAGLLLLGDVWRLRKRRPPVRT